MAEPNRCPTCNSELPPEAPAGLCPACLLKAGMTSDHVEPGTKSGSKAFTPPTPAELAPHFPQLEILELIGQGGMGAVYKAKQVRLDRIVALKVLPKDAERGQEFADRFTREAKAMARLSHPNIIAIHDYGEAGGWFYFVMEFVDGVNMRQAMKSEPIQPKDALAIVTQICDALQYAHEESIVHRDIKPENILLTRKGKVKIADFGLAKLLGLSAIDRHLTATQQVMGTIGYMAPEQMEGSKTVDHRADIYALGVVFYELLTGELPMGRFAPPSQKVQVDIRIDEVVLKSLEKEPSRRYQAASQIKHEVERISAQPATMPIRAADSNHSVTTRLMILGALFISLGLVEFATGVSTIFDFLNQNRFMPIERGLEKQFVFSAMIIDFLWLSPLVIATGLLVLFRVGWGAAIVGVCAAIVPLASMASGLEKPPRLVGNPDWIIPFGLTGIPLGIWGLMELNRPEAKAQFRWPVWPVLVAAWRYLFPRFLNSTFLTTGCCAFIIVVMLDAPWTMHSIGNNYLTRYFNSDATSLGAVFATVAAIVFLLATWNLSWQPVLWRPVITLMAAITVLVMGLVFTQKFPFKLGERVGPGLFATFWAAGILCLNGAWRLSRWFARERPQQIAHSPPMVDRSEPMTAPKSRLRRWLPWLVTGVVLGTITSIAIWIANEPGFLGFFSTELVQTGYVPIQAGHEGQVNFAKPYERPPNIRFTNQPVSDKTEIVEVTTGGFRWKNSASKAGPEALFNTRDLYWEARGERQSPSAKMPTPPLESTQSGNFVITPGQEGWVYFVEKFDRPPNVELGNVGFSKTHIVQCTAEGFQWKNTDKPDDVLWNNQRITWTAKVKKTPGTPPLPIEK